LHNLLPTCNDASRVLILQQTATSFAALLRLLIEGKLIQHRAAQRRFKGLAAGIAVAARLRFVAQIRLENPAALTGKKSS
jgi:hypothetical protein